MKKLSPFDLVVLFALSLGAAYVVAVVDIVRLLPPPEAFNALGIDAAAGWPAGPFVWHWFVFALPSTAAALFAARGPERRLGARARGAVTLAPLFLSLVVLAQDDVLRRGPLLALLFGCTAALSVWFNTPREPIVPEIELAPRGWRQHWPAIAVVVLHALVFSVITVRRDHALWSATVDLGIFMEALWSTLHGHVMYSPTVGYSFLGEHFSPVLFLLVPGYALFPTASYLLVLQASAIALSAWPIYRLGVARGLGRRLATVLAAAMVLAPTMQGAMVYDFHMDLLGVPALAWAIWAASERRYVALAISTALLLSTKEDTFVAAVGIALFMYVDDPKRRVLPSIVMALLSVAWCVLAIKVFLKYYGPPPGVPVYMGDGGESDGYKFLRNFQHLRGHASPLVILLAHPLRYLLWCVSDARFTAILVLTAPVLLACWAAGKRIVVLAPMAILLLSDNHDITVMAYHYGAMQQPTVYAGAVFGIAAWLSIAGEKHGEALRRALALGVGVAAVTLLSIHPRSLLAAENEQDPRRATHHTATFDRIASLVTRDVPVSASSFGGTHFSNRLDVSLFPNGIERATFVMVDLQRPAWPATVASRDALLLGMLRSTQWGVRGCEDGIVLLERAHDTADNRACAMRTFAHRAYEVEGVEQTQFTNDVVADALASDEYARVVRPTDRRPAGFLVYGPGITVPEGRWRATFRLESWPTSFGTAIGAVDVFASGRVVQSRTLRTEDFPDTGWHDVSIEFDSVGMGDVEFRVRVDKQAVLGADRITLAPLDDEPVVAQRMGF